MFENDVELNQPTSRRTLVKLGVAIAGGIVLSSTYVKPSMVSVSLHETAHASADSPPEPNGTAPGSPNGRAAPGGTISNPTNPRNANRSGVQLPNPNQKSAIPVSDTPKTAPRDRQ